MPDPRTRQQRVDDAIADMAANRSDPSQVQMYGFLAVTQAILATAETPPPDAVRMGHFVPIEAWTEFVIQNISDPFKPELAWAVRSTTIDKILEPFDTLDGAIRYRDHLIQNYDRQGAE